MKALPLPGGVGPERTAEETMNDTDDAGGAARIQIADVGGDHQPSSLQPVFLKPAEMPLMVAASA